MYNTLGRYKSYIKKKIKNNIHKKEDFDVVHDRLFGHQYGNTLYKITTSISEILKSENIRYIVEYYFVLIFSIQYEYHNIIHISYVHAYHII